MDKFSFEGDNTTTKRIEKFIDKISFSYHINTFDFPILHGHSDYWEFTVLTDGKLNNILNGEKHKVYAGQVFFSTTDDVHCLKKSGNEKLRYVNIIAREQEVKRLAAMFSPDFYDNLKQMNRTHTFPEELITQITEIIHQVLFLSDDESEKYNGLLCGAALLVMQFLYRKSVDYIDFDKQTEQPEWVKQLNKAMKNPEFLTYNIADLCNLLHYSRMQLSRMFHNTFGATPHQFLISHKLRYAQNLLMTTDMKVIDIAESVGFTNLASFNTYFKNAYGTTPGRFKKNI